MKKISKIYPYRSKALFEEIKQIACALSQLENKGMLAGDDRLSEYEDEYLDISALDHIFPVAKVTRNLKQFNQQLLKIIANYDLEQGLDKDGVSIVDSKEQYNVLLRKNHLVESKLKENEKRNDEAEERYVKLNASYENIKARAIEESKQFRKVIMRLIEMREQTELIKRTQSGEVYDVMDSYSYDITEVLKKANVQIFDDTGKKVDEAKHRIVDTDKTDDAAKVDIICKAVGDGYMLNDSCLKEQKVIVYVK